MATGLYLYHIANSGSSAMTDTEESCEASTPLDDQPSNDNEPEQNMRSSARQFTRLGPQAVPIHVNKVCALSVPR